jgi:cytochrome c oxidase subunit III
VSGTYRPGPYMMGSLRKKGWERQYKSDRLPCPDRIQNRCYSVRLLVGFLWLTILLGTIFLGIKAIEYSHKFAEQLFPGRGFVHAEPHAGQVRLFFGFYFAMTGMHALHMVIGIALLGLFAIRGWRGRYSPEYYAPIELLGLYWHFVDMVWIFLFPLLYLLGRH